MWKPLMQLAPCGACRRHVAVDVTTCPFCAASRAPTSPRWGERARHLSRAAVFAGVTACWTTPGPQTPTQPSQPAERPQVVTPPESTSAFDDRNASYPDPRRAPTPRPDRATIVARFTDRRYQLMSGVRIRIEGPESRTATTGGDGIVIIENLLPGRYRLIVDGIPGPDYAPLVAELDLLAGKVQPMSMLGEHFKNSEAVAKPDNACCKPYGAPPARRRVV